MAQWKRAGPITQRSEDQNLALLIFFSFLFLSFFFVSVFVCLCVDDHVSNLSLELTISQSIKGRFFFFTIINKTVRFILKLMFSFWPWEGFLTILTILTLFQFILHSSLHFFFFWKRGKFVPKQLRRKYWNTLTLNVFVFVVLKTFFLQNWPVSW